MKNRSIFVHDGVIHVFRDRPAPEWEPRAYRHTPEREQRLRALVGQTVKPGPRNSWRWAWHEWLIARRA